ncbi:hypothetical protein DL95DRAFT_481942 [Leptodontidium sp. 2 PMI_412]|nr:hypothetical protein DL95DRAFT_481942 [Leptodontidium sp. 2 PMI_412]
MLYLAVHLIIAAHFTEAATQATQPCTIKSEVNYQLLPSCVNQCLWDIGDDDTGGIGGNMGWHIGCVPPWLNGCYCRPESAKVAHSYIASCATYLCTTPTLEKIASGTSVYASYCSKVLGANDTPEAYTGSTTETSIMTEETGSSPGSRTSMPTLTGTSQASDTAIASTSPGGGGNGGLSQSDKISLGVGIGVGLPATLAALWMCIRHRD